MRCEGSGEGRLNLFHAMPIPTASPGLPVEWAGRLVSRQRAGRPNKGMLWKEWLIIVNLDFLQDMYRNY